jgi:hypothetical protein
LRHTALEKLYPSWPPWRQALHRARHAGDTTPSPGELVANDCFGRVADRERLALEGLIASERCPAEPAAADPSDQDPTEQAR